MKIGQKLEKSGWTGNLKNGLTLGSVFKTMVCSCDYEIGGINIIILWILEKLKIKTQ